VQQLLLTAAATGQVDCVVALIDADNIASSKLARRLGCVPGETVSAEGGLSVRWCRVLTQADATAQDQ
jgi:RimJ/RimL family protein N-acetyltransferase